MEGGKGRGDSLGWNTVGREKRGGPAVNSSLQKKSEGKGQ